MKSDEVRERAAERKRAERKRMRGKGFVLLQAWIPENDLPVATKYVDRLRKRHEKLQKDA